MGFNALHTVIISILSINLVPRACDTESPRSTGGGESQALGTRLIEHYNLSQSSPGKNKSITQLFTDFVISSRHGCVIARQAVVNPYSSDKNIVFHLSKQPCLPTIWVIWNRKLEKSWRREFANLFGRFPNLLSHLRRIFPNKIWLETNDQRGTILII